MLAADRLGKALNLELSCTAVKIDKIAKSVEMLTRYKYETKLTGFCDYFRDKIGQLTADGKQMKTQIRTSRSLLEKSHAYFVHFAAVQKEKPDCADAFSGVHDLARLWAAAVQAGLHSPLQFFRAALKLVAVRLTVLQRWDAVAHLADKSSLSSLQCPLATSMLVDKNGHHDMSPFIILGAIGFFAEGETTLDMEALTEEQINGLEGARGLKEQHLYHEKVMAVWSRRIQAPVNAVFVLEATKPSADLRNILVFCAKLAIRERTYFKTASEARTRIAASNQTFSRHLTEAELFDERAAEFLAQETLNQKMAGFRADLQQLAQAVVANAMKI